MTVGELFETILVVTVMAVVSIAAFVYALRWPIAVVLTVWFAVRVGGS